MTYSSLPSFRDLVSLLLRRPVISKQVIRNWHREGETAGWLSKSAWSLALLSNLRSKNNDNRTVNVWIPDYFCNSSLIPLRKTNCNLIFYPVQENLQPDYKACRDLVIIAGPPDIFLIVHYFGKPYPANPIVEFCTKYNTWLVEDAAHVLKPVKGVGDFGDFVLYSPHKSLPIPDGAVLVVRGNGPSKLSLNFCMDIFARWNDHLTSLKNIFSNSRPDLKTSPIFWITKRILQKFITRFKEVPFVGKFLQENQTTHYGSPEISKISLRLLGKLAPDLTDIIYKRERNLILWDYFFEDYEKLDKQIFPAERPGQNNWTPYLAAYSGEADNILHSYNRLNTKDFFPTTWPDIPPELLKDPIYHRNALKLRNTRLYLPVHQTLSAGHFNKLFKNHNKKHEIAKPETVTLIKNEISREHWHELLKNYGQSNLMQSWAYGNAKAKIEGWKPNRIVFISQQKEIAIAQVLEKKVLGFLKIFRINRGPLILGEHDPASYLQVYEELFKMGKIWKFRMLSIFPELKKTGENISLIFRYYFNNSQAKGYTSLWINLTLELSVLRANLNSKWRNMLVFAEKQELQVESGSSQNLIDWVCDIHNENMKGKGFKGISSEFLKSLALEEDTENPVIVYKATSLGLAVAAVCVAYHGNAATYLIGWTSEEGRRLKANYLLLWEAIKELQDRKKDWFDLGGIDAEATPGITGFKTGMNGELYTIVPAGWSIK